MDKDTAFTKPGILIVDDNEVDSRLLEGMLREEGDFRFYRVTTGTQALEYARSLSDIDLILLDVYLPDASGVDICRTIKSDARMSAISVILISGVLKDSASITAGLEAGADGYLTKPLHINEVRSWSRAGLRLRALMRAETGKVGLPGDDLEVFKQFAYLSHAVNNPLQALMASADLLSISLSDEGSGQSLVNEIQRHADKIASMVAEASAKALLRVDEPR